MRAESESGPLRLQKRATTPTRKSGGRSGDGAGRSAVTACSMHLVHLTALLFTFRGLFLFVQENVSSCELLLSPGQESAVDESSFLSFFGECEKESSVQMELRLTRSMHGNLAAFFSAVQESTNGEAADFPSKEAVVRHQTVALRQTSDLDRLIQPRAAPTLACLMKSSRYL